MRREGLGLVGVLAAALLAGCGGSSSSGDHSSGAGMAGSSGAGTSGDGSDGGDAPGPGGNSTAGGDHSGQASGGSSATGGSSAEADCSGDFTAPPQELLSVPNAVVGSPTLTPDELQLLFIETPPGESDRFFVARRASRSSAFGPPDPLPELDAPCADTDLRSVDLSPDGLRAYVACTPGGSTGLAGTLHIADRASVDGPFTFRAQSFGACGMSVAISHDELTLFSSGLQLGVSAPLSYTRQSLDAVFGAGQEVMGLTGLGVSTPDPSADGSELYGALDSDVVRFGAAAGGGYAPTPNVVAQHTLPQYFGAPELSQDCRRLYFAAFDSTTKLGQIYGLSR